MSDHSYLSGGRMDRSVDGRAMVLVSALFFMWGFVGSLNDILIPHLKAVFDLSYSQAMFVQVCFFSVFLFVAIPSGKLVERFGYKRVIVSGLIVMAWGAMLFVPAADTPSFSLFLMGLTVLAIGVVLLQVSANPYVALLGPSATASSRLTLAQGLNSLGTTIAPYLGELLIFKFGRQHLSHGLQAGSRMAGQLRLEEASSVRIPYMATAMLLVALAFLIGWSRLPDRKCVEASPTARGRHGPSWRLMFRMHPQLAPAAVCIFLYVGAEVSIGSFLVTYLARLTDGAITMQKASVFVSIYWGCAMVGRFLGALLLRSFQTSTALAFAAVGAFSLVALSMMSSPAIAVGAIVSVGTFNSIMFPSIFSLGIRDLGRHTGSAAGILVSAIFGGAVIPYLQGQFADRVGVKDAFAVPAFCYVLIACFAVWAGKQARRDCT